MALILKKINSEFLPGKKKPISFLSPGTVHSDFSIESSSLFDLFPQSFGKDGLRLSSVKKVARVGGGTWAELQGSPRV